MKKQTFLLVITHVAALRLGAAAAGVILVDPPDGAVERIPVPRFEWSGSWSPKPEAMPEVLIEIASDPDFANVVDRDRLAAVIRWYVPARELAPGRYWWRVATVAPEGSESPWSDVRSFSIRLPERVVGVRPDASFAEFRDALASAASNTPAIVRLEGTAYRFDPGDADVFINLDHASDLIVDGGGASIVFTRHLRYMNIRNCRRVLIRDMTLDFDPLPYTAGLVRSVDPAAGTFDVEIAPGHPLPESGPHFAYDKGAMVMDAAGPRMKRGSTLVLRHAGWTPLGGRDYRFTAERPKQISELAPGDIYALDPRVKGCSGFVVNGGIDVTFLRIVAHAVANEAFTSHYADRHAQLGCGMVRRPGRFLAGNNGGHNHHSARLGPWIEDGTWENAGDDTCHVSALPYGILRQIAPDRIHIRLSNPHDPVGREIGLDIRVGDRLQFFNPAAGRLLGEALATEVRTDADFVEVGLDSDIDGIVPGKTGDTAATRVFNADRMCNQFVFRGNTVRNGRRVGVIAKGRGLLIERNTFEGMGAGGVEFWNSPFGGLAAEDAVVRFNRILDCSLMAAAHPAIFISVYKTGADRLHRSILIEDNEIVSATSPAILIRDANNVRLRRNRIVAGSDAGFVGPTDAPILWLNSEPVTLEANDIRRD